MTERTIPDFDLDQIARSGQCFRFRPLGERHYALVAGGRYLEVSQQGQTVRFDCPEDEFEAVWRPYFDLDADYGRYKSAVAKRDKYLQSAIAAAGGLRILRQELWETIACFIISQQNNIRRIRRNVQFLAKRYGRRCVSDEGKVYYSFPSPGELARATEADLRTGGLGYRSRYIRKTVEMILGGQVDLKALEGMDYPSAKAELMRLCGVGGKVADCICLFALHHLEAFPVDTHIKKVLEEQYPEGFPFERYAGFQGVLQQYIFYYDLHGRH